MMLLKDGGLVKKSWNPPSLRTLSTPCPEGRRRWGGPSETGQHGVGRQQARLLAVVVFVMLLCSWGLPQGGEGAQFKIDLILHEDQNVTRNEEPVAGGIPFPQGVLLDPGDIRVIRPDGGVIPVQAHQLGLSWPDGSIRWALVQFQATVKAKSKTHYQLEIGSGLPNPSADYPVTVTEIGDVVRIANGLMQVDLSTTDFQIPNNVRLCQGEAGECVWEEVLASGGKITLVADHEFMTEAQYYASGHDAKDLESFGLADKGAVPWGMITPNIDYSDRFGGEVDIRIEEAGPLRTVLRIERPGERISGDLGFVARIYAYAGKCYLTIELSLINFDPYLALYEIDAAIANTKHIKQFSYTIEPAIAGIKTIEVGGAMQAISAGAEQRVRLLQSSYTKSLLTVGTDTSQYAGQAPGWLRAAGTNHTVELVASRFAEVFPKAMSWEAAGDTGNNRILFEFWPTLVAGGPTYPLGPARMKTYEFLLGFDSEALELSAKARAALHPYPEPDYVSRTGTTPLFIPMATEGFPKLKSYIERTYLLAKDPSVALYGDIDFGDQIGWDATQRWNGYHGVCHEWFLFYMASGDPKYFREAEACAWHMMDVDTFHYGIQTGLREAEGRAEDHLSTHPYGDIIRLWNFGEVDYYFFTGKRRALENIKENREALLINGGVISTGQVTNERATSLPFLHLCNLYYALGEESALASAYPEAMHSANGYPFRNDALSPKESQYDLESLKILNDHLLGVFAQNGYIDSPFMTSYPAEGFFCFYNLTGDPSAREGVLKVADHLYNEMILPSGINYYAGAPYPEIVRWLPWYDGVEAPSALAYIVSGDKNPTLLDYGKAPVDWILNYRGYAYSSGPWTFQGAMGFGGTMGAYLWAMRDAGMTEADLMRMRTDIDYDTALPVMIARAEEYRDLAMQNTEESGIYCSFAAEIGRVMINQGRYQEALEWLKSWLTAPYDVYISWMIARGEALLNATTTTTTTSTTLAVTTTSSSTTTTTIPGNAEISLAISEQWNLLSSAIGFEAATAFGDSLTFASVWTWVNNNGGGTWALYLPGEVAPGSYATAKGFQTLTTIGAGEGFWLNSLKGGQQVTISGIPEAGPLTLKPGWNLLGNKGQGLLAVGDLGPAVVSMWKWTMVGSGKNWAVALPQAADQGQAYAASKGFGELTSIAPGEGFWVNAGE